MFKMGFRRIYDGTYGYFCRPSSFLDFSFNVDVVENELSSFIIYGNTYKSKFEKFDNLKDLRATVDNITEMKCIEYDIPFKPQSDYSFSINLTPKEFRKDYLSKSWNHYNNNFFGDVFSGNVQIDYSVIKDYFDFTEENLGDEEIKRNPSIFDNLSDTDKNDLNELLKEADVEFNLTVSPCDNSTDKLADIAKIYLQNPMFGRF